MKLLDIFKFELKHCEYKIIFPLIIINVVFIVFILKECFFTYNLGFDNSLALYDRYILIQELAIEKYIDFIIPSIASIFILILMSDDYTSNIYEILEVYSIEGYNKFIFIRWMMTFFIFFGMSIIYTIFILSKTNIAGDIYNCNGIFIFDLRVSAIIIKSLPTLLWYTVLPLILLKVIKNPYICFCIISLYIFMDSYCFLYIYPFGAMWNANSYLVMKQFCIENGNKIIGLDLFNIQLKFILNRIVFVFISIIGLKYVCRKK